MGELSQRAKEEGRAGEEGNRSGCCIRQDKGTKAAYEGQKDDQAGE
jgi:hypothetical protein